jgi:hypothetical protein
MREDHRAAIMNPELLRTVLRRPELSNLTILRGQADPIAWLHHHLMVSVYHSVSESESAKDDLPASAPATVGLAAPQGSSALIPLLLVSDCGRFLEPYPALTLCLSIGGDWPLQRAELLKHPSELAALANAVAKTYCEQLAADKPERGSRRAGPVSFRRADPARSYWLQ